MTARMNAALFSKKSILITGFMETVQLNYDLDFRFMKWADVHQRDQSGRTALYWAISHGNMHNIRLLLSHGSTLDVSPTLTAPFCAVACNQLEVLICFIDKGLDRNIRKNGLSLLQYAYGLKRQKIIDYLKRQ